MEGKHKGAYSSHGNLLVNGEERRNAVFLLPSSLIRVSGSDQPRAQARHDKKLLCGEGGLSWGYAPRLQALVHGEQRFDTEDFDTLRVDPNSEQNAMQ